MDNNFDENKPASEGAFSEENFSETTPGPMGLNVPPAEQNIPPAEQNIPPAGYRADPGSGNFSGQPMAQNSQPAENPGGYQNGAGGFPQQGLPNNGFPPYPPVSMGYAPNPNAAYPPPAKPEKRKLSAGCFWALLVTVIVLFALIIILAAMIAAQVKDMKKLKETENRNEVSAVVEKAEHTTINLPTSPKPVLEEELYRNKETGLLTTVGVAKAVLPSQVKIEIYGDMPYSPIASGSGIIISTDGYILTNAHVVDGAKRVAAKFYDDSREEATIVGMDRKSDLAVIKVSRSDLAAAEIGTSSSLVIGEEIAIAGAGGGFENTVTYGHVTGLDREIDTSYISSSTISCIQTDAALNPGNSGGALVNMYGQVVGVTVALMNHQTYENIGFSIAIDDAAPIAEELIANGYVSSRSRVGISYISIGDAAANEYGIMSGLCVMEIDPLCDISNAGLMPYDVITRIDETRVFGAEDIAEALSGKLPGDVVTLTVFRKTVTDKSYVFEVSAQLAPDTDSISGYSEGIFSEDFIGRDIIQ